MRTRVRTVVLNNEAVGALRDPAHRKHRDAVAHLAGVVARRRRGSATAVLVPTAVRVEAGWNRTDATAAFINRFHITDAVLDAHVSDVAADVVTSAGVSVADAHLGAVARSLVDAGHDVVVLTSDPRDIRASVSPASVMIVRL